MSETKRKNIGIFMTGADDQLHGVMLSGICKKAKELNCNLIAFHSLVTKMIFDSEVKLSDTVLRGESSVYFGHDISMLDAAIIMGETFQDDSIKEKLIKNLNRMNLPIINIDDTAEGCSNIRFDDTSGMELVIRHVVEDHGCKVVNFISGFKDNRQSEERILAYKKVLEENGIPIEENRIGYGHFYLQAAGVIKEMVEKDGVPEAVVCANDTMALAVIGYLRGIGVRVPEDCIVAGFDGIKEGQIYIPALTTCKRSIMLSGERALEMAVAASDGIHQPYEIRLEPELIKNQSCGCKKITTQAFDQFFGMMNGRVNDKELFNTNQIYMTRDFASVEKMEDIFTIVFRYIPSFRLTRFSFYLNNNLIRSGVQSRSEQPKGTDDEIYTDTLTCYSWKEGEAGFKISEIEKSVCIESLLVGDEPCYSTISPIYFQEKILGFVEYDSRECIEDLDHLCTMLVNVSAIIGNFCLREEMKYLIFKLNNMYVSDNLTGLYNRFGLYRDAEEMIQKARREGKNVFGIEIDLDRLKYVNDTFGHEAGDNAILQIANAMRYASTLTTVLSRTGGDEYFIIDFDEDGKQAERFIKKVEEYLQNYNEKERLPYLVDCSCGAYMADLSRDSLEDIMKKADVEMYKVKNAKKAARRQGVSSTDLR